MLRKTLWFLGIAAIAAPAAVVAAGGGPRGAPAPAPPPPRVRFQGMFPNPNAKGVMLMRFEVLNPNPAGLPFVGYRPDSFRPPLKDEFISPIYQVELRRGETWKPQKIGWCGNGVGPVQLPPRRPVTFNLLVPDGSWDAVRVGLRWSAAEKAPEQTAWSDPVPRRLTAAAVSAPRPAPPTRSKPRAPQPPR